MSKQGKGVPFERVPAHWQLMYLSSESIIIEQKKDGTEEFLFRMHCNMYQE